MIQSDIAELVDDDSSVAKIRLSQDMIEQRGFSRAEKPCHKKNRDFVPMR